MWCSDLTANSNEDLVHLDFNVHYGKIGKMAEVEARHIVIFSNSYSCKIIIVRLSISI